MKYSAIKYKDIANGEGVRNVLFVSGCTHHCKGCFQPQTWDFNYGDDWDESIEKEFIDACEPSYIEGVTFLGGEPMEEVNQKGLLPLARELKKRYPQKTIWCYTGYTLEKDLLDEKGKAHFDTTAEFLSLIDILVDGEFELDKKDITLQFRGSSNQRILEKNESGEWGPWSKKMK
ncbi:MAG: anaerobic ribonucleoside-triphosphate reductase activating protein [Lachnospiraceae bacterium]|nr:anaerobic ribonucleoside-triphosphate reductase activating protein [Lachnospiraceae bacterium]